MLNTAEKLFVMAQEMSNYSLEVIHAESEWGTVHYDYVLYFPKILEKKLNKARLKDFNTHGVAGALDQEGVFPGDTFEDAVDSAFDYYMQVIYPTTA